MASTLKHLRSSTADKRPTASGLVDGQFAINTASGTPAVFFKDSNGGVVKVGPAHVGATAPNAVPAGSAGNSLGELWVDNSLTTAGLNYYTGSAFVNLTPSGTTTTVGLVELATPAETQTGTDAVRAVTPSGLQSKVSDSTSTTSSTTIASSTAVKSAYDLANAALPKAGGTVTGELLIGNTGSLVFEGSSDDSFETTIAVVDPTGDRTITFPNITGTVVTTGDSGTVTSTMIANDTIVNADVNSAAAIAYSKLALSSGIVNTDISASAAIIDTKLATISTADKVGISALDIDGATDIGGALEGGDLFIVDDGAGGTNRKAPAFRMSQLVYSGVTGDIAIASGGTASISAGVIVNADINSSAAIDFSKLASLTSANILLGNASNVATSTAVTGDVTISNAGVTAIAAGVIVDGDINASAAIAHSKLASITAGQVLLGNASNVPTSTALSGDVTVNSSGVTAISTGVIVNADVNASAAIAGTKISPDFGSQNTTTTGTSTAASFIPTSSTVPTNGVYLPSANNVAISTNGTGRLFVDASGNVGLGTSTITLTDTERRTLQIDYTGSNVTRGAEIRLTNSALSGTGATDGASLLFANTDTYLYTREAGFLELGTSNQGRLRITSAGLVGVGTSAPSALLHVSGGRTYLGSSDGYELAFARTGNYFYLYNDGGNLSGKLSLTTSAGAGGGEIITFTQDTKRVGVGTTAPNTILDVNGAITLRSSGTIRGYVGDVDADTNIQVRSEAQTIFKIGNNEAARIDASRRLLVGTSSDSGGALLQINGNRIRIATAKTPASASDTGTTGEVCWDANYIYVCTATNTWKRTAIATW